VLTAPTPKEIESVVHSKIRAVLEERDGVARPIQGADKLNATLGLSSLDLAVIVAELEIELGADPFAKLVPITSIRSVDDLVEAYRKAFVPDAKPATQQQDLAAAMERAERRRTRRVRK
jgi:acyl carrier protein